MFSEPGSGVPTHLMSASSAPSFCIPWGVVLLAMPAELISPGD